jgi:hypothetical protein
MKPQLWADHPEFNTSVDSANAIAPAKRPFFNTPVHCATANWNN